MIFIALACSRGVDMEGEEALPGSAGCNASCNACNACVTPIFRHALRSKRWYIKQNYML